jgi:predicted GNAT family acetyltransferase
MRSATEADRALLVDWFAAFDAEAVGDGADAAAAVDRHFRAGTIRLYEDDDHVVSMLVSMPVTPRAVRIGGVYTPPDLRGRGYASRLVADATREALAGGSEYVCLLTDVSNPTSNAIYRSLGYAPAGQFTIIDF